MDRFATNGVFLLMSYFIARQKGKFCAMIPPRKPKVRAFGYVHDGMFYYKVENKVYSFYVEECIEVVDDNKKS